MNPTDNEAQILARIADILTKQATGVIILPTNPSADAVASATSLYLALVKNGKNVTLICSSPVTADFIAAEKIQPNLSVSGNNLVISFPYVEGAVDKVDCNIQSGNFNIVIAPRSGFPKLDPTQVKYSYSGGSFDFIITIDSPNLNSLGEVYLNNQSQFQGKDIINIDRHLTNGMFGTVNFVNKTTASISELIFKLLQYLKVTIDKDIATNLYAGIAASTNNFTSYSVNANTFETIAQLLRLGAVKKIIRRPIITPPVISNNVFQATKSREAQPKKPLEEIELEPQPDEKKTTPQDWLKPKIFRGGGLV